MKKLFFILLATVMALGAIAEAPKHEMRGVWLTTAWALDWPSKRGTSNAVREHQQAELSAMLDLYTRMNLTTVMFQVRPMADALYRSEREPWSRFISDSRGTDPGWDPLEWMVRECHARGLECYAWVNPFRAGKGKNFATASDRQFDRDGWLLTYGNQTVLNPGLAEVRQHIVSVCRDIITGYAVDGLIFDDYFYPNRIPADESAPDYELYCKSGKLMSFGDWRRANVHKLVADINAMIFDLRPDVRFGISPAGVAGRSDTSASRWNLTPLEIKAADWQWTDIYSDPIGWLRQGTVDFVSPQLYWPTDHETAPFHPLAQWWDYAAMSTGRHAFPSISLADLDKGVTNARITDHLLQIDATANHATAGVMLYSARFVPRISESIAATGRFATKALTPTATWKFPHVYPAVTDLHRSGRKLHWHSVKPDGQGAIVRYAIYAWPRGMTPEEAADGAIDSHGFAAEYLQGITYTPEFSLPRHIGHDDVIAVTVLDGNSFEHPASFLK